MCQVRLRATAVHRGSRRCRRLAGRCRENVAAKISNIYDFTMKVGIWKDSEDIDNSNGN